MREALKVFSVAEVGLVRENAVTTLGFRSPQATPDGAILLSVSDEDDVQDKALGLDGLYLEIGDQSVGGYHAVEAMRLLGPDLVRVDLTEKGCLLFGMENFILDFSGCPGEPLEQLAELLKPCGDSDGRRGFDGWLRS